MEKSRGVQVLKYSLPGSPLSIAETEAENKEMKITRGMTLQVQGNLDSIEKYVDALNGLSS